jgi:hypothetical protein
MINKKSVTVQPVPKDLRGSFESAVRDLRQAGLTGKISARRTPIAQRSRSIGESEVNAQKRAVFGRRTGFGKPLESLSGIKPLSSPGCCESMRRGSEAAP